MNFKFKFKCESNGQAQHTVEDRVDDDDESTNGQSTLRQQSETLSKRFLNEHKIVRIDRNEKKEKESKSFHLSFC